MKNFILSLFFAFAYLSLCAQANAIVTFTTSGDSIIIGAGSVIAVVAVNDSTSRVYNSNISTRGYLLDKPLDSIMVQSPTSWIKVTSAVTKRPFTAGDVILINRDHIISLMYRESDGLLYVKNKNPYFSVSVEGDILILVQCYIDVVDGF